MYDPQDETPDFCPICRFTWESHENEEYYQHKLELALREVPDQGVWFLVEYEKCAEEYRWFKLADLCETIKICAVSNSGEIIERVKNV